MNPECGREIESLAGVAYEIHGYDQDRKDGGTNTVLWRKRTGRVLCATCTLGRKHGVHPQQPRLS